MKSWVLGAVSEYSVPFTKAVGSHTTVSVPHSMSMITLKTQVYGVGVARSIKFKSICSQPWAGRGRHTNGYAGQYQEHWAVAPGSDVVCARTAMISAATPHKICVVHDIARNSKNSDFQAIYTNFLTNRGDRRNGGRNGWCRSRTRRWVASMNGSEENASHAGSADRISHPHAQLTSDLSASFVSQTLNQSLTTLTVRIAVVVSCYAS